MTVYTELVGIPILREMVCVDGLEGEIDGLNGVHISTLIIANISVKY